MLERVPQEGLQPQVVLDESGIAHLLYYAGDAKGGNLFYTRRRGAEWEKPLRVNSRDHCAIAVGTIRGGQMAVGAGGRVHVAWNGNKPWPGSSHKGAPMFYTRLNRAGTGFDPERDVMTFTEELDGGGSVAADGQGNVYVVWHGHAPGARAGEAGRAVYVAKSTDHGATFAKEVAVSPDPTGTCGCCGLKALATRSGDVYVLYRAATEVVHRDVVLLASSDGVSFRKLFADPWKVATCPMSSAALIDSGERVITAWETAGQVHLGIITGGKLSRVTPAGGAGKRKHPAIATNAKGEILLVWTEGTGWQRGGALGWQLFDGAGTPLKARGRADGVPTWSFAGAYAEPGGSFVVLY